MKKNENEGQWDILPFNWPILTIVLMGIAIWYYIFKIGFFSVLMWVIISAAIVGIICKVKEMRW